ncbi:MAG TPA: hypothetical protein VLD67_18860 [Vicinamibacterales bacterium]|nr:hypothetical protein [Vicinamibacterales bacterium]
MLNYIRGPHALLIAALLPAACGANPSSPSDVLTATLESENFSFRFSPGENPQVDKQEAHHAWATAQLGIVLPQKIIYNKYRSREQMREATGRGNTNGFAEPESFTVHTLFSWNNHEPIHVYTARIGRPSDFFDEGIAVAFQTDPAVGDFESRFNGQQVHEAAAEYRAAGQLLRLDQCVETSAFRAISDATLAYREAGSYMKFLIDRHGLDPVKDFFRISGRNDSRSVIRERFQAAFGQSLDTAETEWLASLPVR